MRLYKFSIVCILLAVSLFISCKEMNNEEVERIIIKSEKLTALNKFCMSVPKPSGFNLINKRFNSNSRSSGIGYHYHSELSFTEVRDFYLRYFEAENWDRENLWNESDSFHSGLIKYRKNKKLLR